jgi:hypothetical protein
MLGRVGEETNKRRTYEARTAELERKLAESERRTQAAEELARRVQTGDKAPPPVRDVTPPVNEASRQQEINQAATMQRLAEESRDIDARGVKQFGREWSESVSLLQSLDGNNLDFMADVLAADRSKAPEIIHALAKEPERLATIITMNPRQRAAELARVAMTLTDTKKTDPEPKADAKPAAKQVSKAPAPKPQLAPVAAALEVDPRTPEGNEKMTDAQFEQWYKAKYLRKTG